MSMDKRPAVIGQMFDRIAPTYDKLNTILSLGIDRLWRRRAVRLLGASQGQLCLDIASGTGDLARAMLRQGGGPVIGVDLSRQMLAQTGGKLSRGTYQPVAGDALRLPFRDESFERAMVGFGVRNMQNFDGFLSETRRVLKERGRLAILEFSLPTIPVIRPAYLFYFTRVLPLIGGLISGERAAYAYLRDSVLDFPAPEALETRMLAQGFDIDYSRPLMFGIAHLYILEKA